MGAFGPFHPPRPAVLNAIESRLRGYGLGKVSPECHSLCWNMLQPHDDGFPRIGISDSLPACVCSMPCWLHCEAVWTSFPTSVVDRTPLIAYPTSAWRRFRCFSCRARRSSLVSGSSRRAMGDPTARVCSACRRSRATITFVTCWIRRRRRCFIRHSLKRSHSWGGSRAGSTRLRGKGDTEYYHAMLAATLVAPGHDKVIPLEPEFIVPQDGAEKQDCENMAAKRWLAAHGRRYAALDAIYLGDDLFSRQPLCQAVRDVD